MTRVVALVALATAGVLAGCGQQANSGAPPTPSSSVSPMPTPTPQPSVTPSASPAPTDTPAWPPSGFSIGTVSGGSSSTIVTVTSVRVGAHGTYDRFVIEFSGAVPTYSVTVQSGTQFTTSPKGTRLTLEGRNGVLVAVQHINWTAYAGPSLLRPDYPYLREARLIQNFEGVQQWGLGIAGAPAIRVFTLNSPSRLVIDVVAD